MGLLRVTGAVGPRRRLS